MKKVEWTSVQRANILIGTPGRFAQHQTENSYLDTSNIRLLILDEADRLLDSTFRQDMEVIVQNLSSERQTMLFSATLNKYRFFLFKHLNLLFFKILFSFVSLIT